jgi:hypothetical protein
MSLLEAEKLKSNVVSEGYVLTEHDLHKLNKLERLIARSEVTIKTLLKLLFIFHG